MNLPDVNVLIYAFRRGSIRHEACKAWLENVANAETQFGISPLSLSALVRIVTNPRVFPNPATSREVFGFCDALLARTNCTQINPGERHWTIFRRLVQEVGARGNMVTDAWYAALAIEHGCTFITFDRDYAHFSGLDWRAPV